MELSADQFVATRYDLPDGGRWTELIAGETRIYDPPSVAHGNVIYHLSKAVAAVLQPTSLVYALFDVGIQTRRFPDTIRFPPMSLFSLGNRFEQMDRMIAEPTPVLVLEIASTNDRRREVATRVHEYHRLGVETVWVADPFEPCVTVLTDNQVPQTLKNHDLLTHDLYLPGFSISIARLFEEPVWWRDNKRTPFNN